MVRGTLCMVLKVRASTTQQSKQTGGWCLLVDSQTGGMAIPSKLLSAEEGLSGSDRATPYLAGVCPWQETKRRLDKRNRGGTSGQAAEIRAGSAPMQAPNGPKASGGLHCCAYRWFGRSSPGMVTGGIVRLLGSIGNTLRRQQRRIQLSTLDSGPPPGGRYNGIPCSCGCACE